MNYVCVEMESKITPPKGAGWEYWGDKVLLGDDGQEIARVSVWRRDADIFGYPEDEEMLV